MRRILATLGALVLVAMACAPPAGPPQPETPLVEVDNIAAIDAGSAHTCALLTDANVMCWGGGELGQLGDGKVEPYDNPAPVPGLTGVTKVSTNRNHTCALIGDGTVQCWGSNATGQIGDGTDVDALSPTPVAGIANAIDVTAGWNHTCALLADTTVKCWGRNDKGQLGDGTNTDRSSPVTAVGLTGVESITSGYQLTCALLADSTGKCWGFNLWGQVGDGSIDDRNEPTTVSGLDNIEVLETSGGHTCALLDDEDVYCWGRNEMGQIGSSIPTGTGHISTTPTIVPDVSGVDELELGNRHTCVAIDGTPSCWGENTWGGLGDGSRTNRSTAAPVENLTGTASMGAGILHTCAVMPDGSGWCWGRHNTLQIGSGEFSPAIRPKQIGA